MDMYDKIVRAIKKKWDEEHFDWLYEELFGVPLPSYMLHARSKESVQYADFESPLERAFVVILEECSRMEELWKQPSLLRGDNYMWLYQYPIDNYRIDFVLDNPYKKLAVEIDGYQYHDRDRKQFDDERERQNLITKHDFRLLRYTYSHLINNIEAIRKEIAQFILNEILLKAHKEAQKHGNNQNQKA